MVLRIKIVTSIDPGSVVNQVNKLLADGWQHLDQSVIAVHEVSNNIKLVSLYTVWLIKEVHENAM